MKRMVCNSRQEKRSDGARSGLKKAMGDCIQSQITLVADHVNALLFEEVTFSFTAPEDRAILAMKQRVRRRMKRRNLANIASLDEVRT